MNDIVIIGAGQAGGWAARTLRDSGFKGSIRLFGEEAYPPYERPPLSKAIMTDAATPDSSFLWSPENQAELAILARYGARVTRIDRGAKRLTLADGSSYPYDRLLLTTGSRVRRLNIPGSELGNIHYLRGIDDALAIRQTLKPGTRLLIVGAGWIGMEVAASARQLGAEVVVADVCAYPCARVLPENIGHYLLRRHADHGVRFLMDTTVERFSGSGSVENAHLSNGETLPVSSVVIGVGAIPNSELATDAGLTTDNGIVVDEYGRSSDAAIFAAGDVANQPAGNGARVRFESWANAQNQAIAVARSMLGQGEPYRDIPYFWSDQYDITLQIVGSRTPFDEIALRGSLDGEKFIQFYLLENRIVGAIGIDCAQEISVTKKLMQRGLKTTGQQLMATPVLRTLLTTQS